MKVTKYECDSPDCGSSTDNIERDKWIEIGSSDNISLMIRNYFDNKRLISLERCHDIHFCCPDCIVNYLILKI
jgi:hypothetical protein